MESKTGLDLMELLNMLSTCQGLFVCIASVELYTSLTVEDTESSRCLVEAMNLLTTQFLSEQTRTGRKKETSNMMHVLAMKAE
jgi:hypothetical protein